MVDTYPDKVPWITHHVYTVAANTLQYIPFKDQTETTTITSVVATAVAPADGDLIAVHVRSDATTPGVTTVAFHKDENASGTAADATEDIDTADVNHKFTWATKDSSFNQGQKQHISIDPTGNHGQMTVTCVWSVNKAQLES